MDSMLAPTPVLGIITALPAEAHSLGVRKLSRGKATEIAPNTWLCVSGSGAANAAAAFDALPLSSLTHLINWGVAGALHEDCRNGDLLVPTVMRDKETRWSMDSDWHREFRRQIQIWGSVPRACELYTSPHIVASPKERRTLACTSGCGAVDMEAGTLANLAQKRGLPLVIVKVIADECHTSLPHCVLRHTDPYGRPVLPGFAWSLCTHPGEWKSLWGLAKSYRLAIHHLSALGSRLLDHRFFLPSQL